MPLYSSGGGGDSTSFVKAYDFSVDGAVNTFAISAAELGDWNEIIIMGEGLNSASADAPLVELSDDSGATYFNSVGDYRDIQPLTGEIQGDRTGLLAITNTSNQVKAIQWRITRDSKGQVIAVASDTQSRNATIFQAVDGATIDSFRVRNGGGNNWASGTITVHKRVWSG